MNNTGLCNYCCGIGIVTNIENFQEVAYACKLHLVEKDYKKKVHGKIETVTVKVPYYSGLAFYQELYDYGKTQFPWDKSIFLDYNHCFVAYKSALYYFGYWRQDRFKDPMEYLDDLLKTMGVTHEKMIKQILEINPEKTKEYLKKAELK